MLRNGNFRVCFLELTYFIGQFHEEHWTLHLKKKKKELFPLGGCAASLQCYCHCLKYVYGSFCLTHVGLHKVTCFGAAAIY